MHMPNLLAQNSEHVSVPNPGARVASSGMLAALAWLGASSWADVAALLGAIYTAMLMTEFCWRKFVRPCWERRGWIKPLPRRRNDDRRERWERDQ